MYRIDDPIPPGNMTPRIIAAAPAGPDRLPEDGFRRPRAQADGKEADARACSDSPPTACRMPREAARRAMAGRGRPDQRVNPGRGAPPPPGPCRNDLEIRR